MEHDRAIISKNTKKSSTPMSDDDHGAKRKTRGCCENRWGAEKQKGAVSLSSHFYRTQKKKQGGKKEAIT